MSRGINKVILIGNLGADPETRAMPSGLAVCNIRVATSEQWKDKQSGESKERTEWHSVAAFGKLADIMGEYLKKGSKVYIEGSLRTRKWQDKQGNDRYTTEIIADVMQMLDGKPAGHREDEHRTPPNQRQNPGPNGDPSGKGEFDDEIPF